MPVPETMLETVPETALGMVKVPEPAGTMPGTGRGTETETKPET